MTTLEIRRFGSSYDSQKWLENNGSVFFHKVI